ncbi:MAG: hypothetical protein LJE69_00385 [Thiohalocapsa sp.]|uniref:hypothetical protein n=1 Tax=Thiohalocapsa sp. TaxID=2497641 RepID=UPI0025D0956D|nr:hypothetical protein [Thiohalocapsa sp.]MCG6939695.1 hypothetical protein [Thiohalocapsa sp.]
MTPATHHRIRLSGRLLPGADAKRAAATLAQLLRTTPERAAALLDGSGRSLRGRLSAEQAGRVCKQLRAAGIDCVVDAEASTQAPASATPPEPAPGTAPAPHTPMRPPSAAKLALAAAAQTTTGLAPATTRCPACGAEQTGRDVCTVCDIVFEKYHARQRAGGAPGSPAPAVGLGAEARAAETWRVAGQLLLLALLVSIAVALYSHWRRNQLPEPGFYDLHRLAEPRQTRTGRQPFQVEENGIVYSIQPVADYALDGVVVSLHDADAFTDIWHHNDWQDFLNIRDLCVVWGGNVAGGVIRDMYFHNGNWTCWAEARDSRLWARFNPYQLSNNHVLADDPAVRRAIRRVRVGDQIRFHGVLAKYAHGGGFSRGTSVTRTDSGNGACETVYIDEIEILRRPNRGWRLAYRVSLVTGIAALLGWVAVLALGPVARRR